jgi:hypothetical protein
MFGVAIVMYKKLSGTQPIYILVARKTGTST